MKKGAAAALAGAAMALPSCSPDDSEFFPGPGKNRRHHDGKDSPIASENRCSALFTASDRHEMGSGNNLPSVLKNAVEGSEVKPSVVLLGGDYVGGKGNMTPEFPISSLYDEIYPVLEAATCDVLFTYGSHDNCCTDGYSAFFSGPHRCDGYYIYGISFLQMSSPTDQVTISAQELRNTLLRDGKDNDEFEGDDIIMLKAGYSGIDLEDRFGKSATSASENFLKWVDSLKDNAPIVVISHMPMHAMRGDNLGGSIWFDAITRAAKTHDVIFLWGHNHTLEEGAKDMTDRTDEKLKDRFLYLLTPSDLLTPGDTIDIQGPTKDSVETKDLNFTYANAGYLKLGYGTVITFSGKADSTTYEKVTFHRFPKEGLDEETKIGFTGKTNPYTVNLVQGQSGSGGNRRV